MAEKLNDFASRLAKGTPKGLGLGMKVLLGASAAVYGIYRSMYTGKMPKKDERENTMADCLFCSRRWTSSDYFQSYWWSRSEYNSFRRITFQVDQLVEVE